jgi:hypothetical protein
MRTAKLLAVTRTIKQKPFLNNTCCLFVSVYYERVLTSRCSVIAWWMKSMYCRRVLQQSTVCGVTVIKWWQYGGNMVATWRYEDAHPRL